MDIQLQKIDPMDSDLDDTDLPAEYLEDCRKVFFRVLLIAKASQIYADVSPAFNITLIKKLKEKIDNSKTLSSILF